MPMPELRQLTRNRVYYGGSLTHRVRSSTLTCLVRNFSQFGAKIELDSSDWLPNEVDFAVERKHFSCRARLVWRYRNAAGLQFCDSSGFSGVVPLEWARRLRANENLNRQLRARIERLLTER